MWGARHRKKSEAMTATKILLRYLAIATILPAIIQTLGPLKHFFQWLNVLLSPGFSYANPSTLEVGSDACRELTQSLALLSVPLVLWIISPGVRFASGPN